MTTPTKKPFLTLYVLPGDNPTLDDVERCRESVLPYYAQCVTLDHRDALARQPKPDTEWWGFLWANEWLDPRLSTTLVAHLRHNKADCLTLFKRVVDSEKKERHFVETRIFRTDAVPALGLDTYKVKSYKLTFEKVLDGFVLETDRL